MKKGKFRKLHDNSGYTLIELLTVTMLLVIVFGLIASIFYSTLRGTSKTKITSSITQNGNYAITVMSGAIASSTNVIQIGDEEVSNCTTAQKGYKIVLARESGDDTIFECDAANRTIASRSASLSVDSSLLDTSTVEVDAGDINACYFKCTQPNSDKYAQPRIEVYFEVTDKSSEVAESQGSQVFKQTVTMRNFNPR